jgi:hypothetical protein
MIMDRTMMSFSLEPILVLGPGRKELGHRDGAEEEDEVTK